MPTPVPTPSPTPTSSSEVGEKEGKERKEEEKGEGEEGASTGGGETSESKGGSGGGGGGQEGSESGTSDGRGSPPSDLEPGHQVQQDPLPDSFVPEKDREHHTAFCTEDISERTSDCPPPASLSLCMHERLYLYTDLLHGLTRISECVYRSVLWRHEEPLAGALAL